MNSLILNNRGSFDRASTLCLLTSDICNKYEHETVLDCAWQNIRWSCAVFSCVNFEWQRVRVKYLSWFSFHSTGSYILASINRDKVYWTRRSSFYCTKIFSNIFHINVCVSLFVLDITAGSVYVDRYVKQQASCVKSWQKLQYIHKFHRNSFKNLAKIG